MKKNIYNAEQERLTEDEEVYWATHRAMCRAYHLVERVGLRDFIFPDGTVFGYDGKFILMAILEHFQALEWYDRCAYLRDLLTELEKLKKKTV